MELVSVRRVPDYDDEALYRAVSAHFEALGVDQELTPDMRVVLKPNLLAGRDPSLGVTTHPAVLRAVARRLRELGVRTVILADSPGGLFTPAALHKIYTPCGLNPLADVLTLNEDCRSSERNGFPIMQAILDADYIINCPKLKTHGLAVMTAGVKNLFGCIPGLKKPEYHYLKPTSDSFSELLLRLCETVKPNLTLLDAVDCMEGNGPGGGKIRTMGYVLASRSPYALDEAAVSLMGLNPILVPTVRFARRQGLVDPKSLEWVGDPILPANPPFLLPDAIISRERFFSANGLFHCFFSRKRTYPVIRPEKCIGCGKCAESCPRHLIDVVERKAVIARKGCISCFCCQEMCPAHAIDAERKRAW